MAISNFASHIQLVFTGCNALQSFENPIADLALLDLEILAHLR